MTNSDCQLLQLAAWSASELQSADTALLLFLAICSLNHDNLKSLNSTNQNHDQLEIRYFHIKRLINYHSFRRFLSLLSAMFYLIMLFCDHILRLLSFNMIFAFYMASDRNIYATKV
ncbi:hypothetical protein T07_929 [Trichinella nelsoni]|uniref:Uncharacterized protein n=1 Tax=Trichinella nelsoni TaxID=6336 RepID=A0A0V0RJQ1_9BILA|nr:hypothetical protein T07_929 [Trichinella nelsoni]